MSVIENLTARVERLEEIVAEQTKLLQVLANSNNETTDALNIIADALKVINDGDS